MLAAIDRARPQAGEVAAGAGLREALAPAFLAGEDALQVPLFLRLGAELDQGRAEQVDRAVPGEDRRMRAEILLVEESPAG